MHRLRQAANDKYFKRLINNFLQKLNLATKTQRKMRSIFLLRAFGPLWLTPFRS